VERKPFKSPDLHAPRNRKKAVNFLSYANKDPYGFFAVMKQQHPDLQSFTNKEIAGWLKAYLKLLAQEVIANRQGVRLPGGLGAVVIGLNVPTKKTAGFNIDFCLSKRLGIQVPYKNHHSDGRLAKIYYYNNIPWDRLDIHNSIRFEPCRKLKRDVAYEMKSGGYNRYLFFSPNSPIRDIFRKRKLPKADQLYDRKQEVNRGLLANHDEFRFD
jgi:hypothetical protein